MTMKNLITILIILTVLITGEGWGATRTVCSSGADYTSMVAAQTAATDGVDTISVCPGTYEEEYSAAYSMGFTKNLTWVATGTVIVGKSDRTTGPIYVANSAAGLRVTGSFIFDGFNVAGGYGVVTQAGTTDDVQFVGSTFRNNATTHMTTIAGNTNWLFDQCVFDDSPANYYFINVSPSLSITNSTVQAFTKRSFIYDNKASGTLTLTNNTVTVNTTQGWPIIYLINAGSLDSSGNSWTIQNANNPIIGAVTTSTGGASSTARINDYFHVSGLMQYDLITMRKGNWSFDTGGTVFVVDASAVVTTDKSLVSIIDQSRVSNLSDMSITSDTSGDVTIVNVYSTDGTPEGAHLIQRNFVTTNSTTKYVFRVGTEVSGAGDNMINGVIITDNQWTAPSTSTTLHGILYGFSSGSVHIGNNFGRGGSLGIVLKGANTDFASAVIDNNILDGQEDVAIWAKGALNVKPRNNTISGVSARGLQASINNAGELATGFSPVNNIITSSKNGVDAYYIDSDSSLNFTPNNNQVYKYGTGGTIGSVGGVEYLTFTLWQAAGYDTNGVSVNPGLSSSYVPTNAQYGTTPLTTTDYNGTPWRIDARTGFYSVGAIQQPSIMNRKR